MMDSKNILFVVKLQEVIFQYLQDQGLPNSDLAHVDHFLSALKQHAVEFKNTKVELGSEELLKSSKTTTSYEEGIENVKINIIVEGSCESMNEVGEVNTHPITSKLEPLALEDQTETSQRYAVDKKSSVIKEIVRCSFCEIDFEDREEANKHDNENHIVNGQIKCTMCDFFEKDKKILVKHFLKTHKKVACFDCNDCDNFFLSIDELRSHMLEGHNIEVRRDTCLICFKPHTRYHALDHMYNEHLSMEFPCEVCQKVFNAPNALKSHEYMHEGERRPCSICGKEVLEKRLKKHLETHQLHQGEKTVKCTECDGMYYTEEHMKTHRSACHSDKIKKCPKCDYSTTKKSIYRHMVMCSKETKYKCDECELSFKDKYYVASHKKKVHVGLRNFKCDYCPKAFKSKTHLKRHLDIHLENYNAQCETCGMKFVQLGNYKLHLKTKHNIGLVKLENE